jgi:hypothetical protein
MDRREAVKYAFRPDFDAVCGIRVGKTAPTLRI